MCGWRWRLRRKRRVSAGLGGEFGLIAGPVLPGEAVLEVGLLRVSVTHFPRSAEGPSGGILCWHE